MLSSLLWPIFGTPETTYSIGGVTIFCNDISQAKVSGTTEITRKTSNIFSRMVTYLADGCLNNGAFKVLTFAYAHTLVAVTAKGVTTKVLTGKNVHLSMGNGNGEPKDLLGNDIELSPNQSSIIETIGPVAEMLFSGCLLTASLASRNYVPLPITAIVAGGAATWMAGNLLVSSVVTSSGVDFGMGKVGQRGLKHSLSATAALAASCALSVFTALKIPGIIP